MERLETIITKDEESGKMPKDNTMDPSQFDATMKKLLIGQGAEKYLNIFRQHNIGQSTLTLLSEADLIKLGVDDAQIRQNIINMVKDLPIYDELSTEMVTNDNCYTFKEISDILTESTEHLNRIYLSLYSNTRALSKDGITDSLLYEDKFASDVALSTLHEISIVLDCIDNTLQKKMMIATAESKKRKKILVGALGSAIIITLSVLFVRSLKHLK